MLEGLAVAAMRRIGGHGPTGTRAQVAMKIRGNLK
jgi:hypothetical protein